MVLNIIQSYSLLFYILIFLGGITLIIALYIIQKSEKNKITYLLFSILLICSFNAVSLALSTIPITADLNNNLYKLQLISWIIGLVIFYLLSLFLNEKVSGILKFQRSLTLFLIIPFNLILTILVPFTGIFVNWSSVVEKYPNQIDLWVQKSFPTVWILVVTKIILSLLSIYNLYRLWKNTPNNTYYKNATVAIFISSSLGLTAISFGAVASYLSERINTVLSLVFIDFAMLLVFGSTLILVFAVIEFNAFIEEGRKILIDFISTLLSYLLWSLIYFTLTYSVLNTLILADSIPIIFILSIIMPIIAINNNAKVKLIINDLLENREISLHNILEEEIIFVIKNLNSLNQLSKSSLLGLQTVKLRKKQKGISSVIALSEVFFDIVKELKPKQSNGRSRPNLKYEIIRMIIDDQAVESQILWNLGFENHSKVKTDHLPNYIVSKNSEYKATSIMSYRRLKREVLDEIRWKLIEKEKQSLRIKE